FCLSSPTLRPSQALHREGDEQELLSRRLLVAGLLLWLAAPGYCDEAFARFDLELNRGLVEQNRSLLEAAQVMEEWASGRLDSQGARRALGQQLEQLKGIRARLAGLPANSEQKPLRTAFLDVSSASIELVEAARAFQQGPDPDRKALKSFASDHLERSGQVQARWLTAQEQALGQAMRGAHGQVLSYYVWLGGVLPLRRQSLELAQSLQAALLREDPDLGAIAGQAIRRAIRLSSQVQASRPAASVQAAHEALLAEQVALARLCEGVALHAQDKSADSASRVRRYSRQFTRATLEAEERRLAALEAALRQKR
ncbi:MAG: hypothetical protein KC910_35810, partial [Candidatus Eremiobacteraeota bacterium]|nr:hypothetical protein [Candidatus Eremiobacteraeota bacterium]